MRIVLLTSNAIRHRFVANTLADAADAMRVVSECKPSDAAQPADATPPSPIARHFRARFAAEKQRFGQHTCFHAPTLPLARGEANLPETYEALKAFAPDMMVAFGSCIIREPLLSLLPPGRFVNLHLGLSPYYRGSGTNFWPFVNDELEYVGATLLHIDAGVDTGDIIAHVRPTIALGDDVHTVGCKVIEAAAHALVEVMTIVKQGGTLPRVKQWDVPDARYYRRKDFTEAVLARYQRNLDAGLVGRYVAGPERTIRLVALRDAQ